MKKAIKRYKGSMTVEAVFVFPLLIVILVLIIWLAFYLHDCLLTRGMLQQAKEGTASAMLEAEYAEESIKGKLYLCELQGIYIRKSDTAVQAEAQLFVPGFLGKARWTQRQMVICDEKSGVEREKLTRIVSLITRWKDGS